MAAASEGLKKRQKEKIFLKNALLQQKLEKERKKDSWQIVGKVALWSKEKKRKTIKGFILDNDCLATAAKVEGEREQKINWQLATIAKLPNKKREQNNQRVYIG